MSTRLEREAQLEQARQMDNDYANGMVSEKRYSFFYACFGAQVDRDLAALPPYVPTPTYIGPTAKRVVIDEDDDFEF